jgi:large subunit ribosomal protein L15
MQTHQLQRNNPNMKRTIVARGGKRGKTAGRGGKGQSARAGNKRRPEWRDIIKRVPKLRGRGISPQKSFQEVSTVLNVDTLEMVFAAGDAITPSILIEKGLVSTKSGNIPTIKILGDGEVTKAFKLSGLYISGSAKEKIEKASGTVTVVVEKVIAKPAKIEKVKAPKIEKEAGSKEKEAVKTEKSAKKEKAGEKKAAK